MGAWADIDPKTATWSGDKNMLIPYRTLIDVPFLRKIANNTGYNYGKQQEVILNNLLLTRQTARRFDSERDWTDAYVQMILIMSTNQLLPLPQDPDMNSEPSMIYGILYTQMQSSYQTWLGIHYKYSTAGGFWLTNFTINLDFRITGSIIKLRRVVGSDAS